MSAQIIRTVLDEEFAALLSGSVDLWPDIVFKWSVRQQKQARNETLLQTHPRLWARIPAWIVLTVIILVGAVFATPQWRTAAANKLSHFWQTLGISGDSRGMVTFSEDPSFVVYQPAQLPDGFVLKIIQGYSGKTPDGGNGPILTTEIIRQDGIDMPPSSILNEWVKAYRSDLPHALFAYQSEAGEYVLLYERAAQPNEPLPPGLERIINGYPATLQQDEHTLVLTWVQNGTWLTLEGTADESTLMDVAKSLEQTGIGEQIIGGREVGRLGEDLPFCNPADEPPSGPLLGSLAGQQQLGSITITFLDSAFNSEGVSYSINRPDRREDLFHQVIAALKNPDLTLKSLPYPTLSQYVSSTEEPCLRPDPKMQGYIVIEIWGDQVNVGYGGKADQYLDRAIKALESELNED